jgi:signal transduction histidine kinase
VSLRTRLLAAFAYVLLLVLVALELPLALNLSRRVDAEIKSEAQGQAQLVAIGAGRRLDEPEELTALLRNAAADLGGRVIVVDARGRLLADSAGSGLRSTSYATRPEIRTALAGRFAQGTRQSASLDQELLFTAVPIVEAGEPRGAVRVTQSVDAVNDEVRRDILALIGVGGIALLLGLGVAWLLASSLARPLRGLASTARRVADGDLEGRADVTGSREQRDVALAFNDMTERLARALRSQREFVANASHQLRTPLTGLRLRLEAAALKSHDPKVARELEEAEAETERLAKLLSELLTLASERERPAAEELMLAQVAEEARDRWAAPAERSGHVLVLAGSGEPAVCASRADLAIVLDNLIENALNYSPPGSSITVEWTAAGDDAVLAVLDEGPGVSAEERERVFERFFRGEAARGGAPGTGLGLAVVSALVQRWEGSVRLTAREARGTRAEVRLPAVAPRTREALPAADPELDRALPGRG